MFPLRYDPHTGQYQLFDPSGQLLSLQRVFQQHRQAAEDAYRTQLEESNRRMAQSEVEHARRMAELQREAEAIRCRRTEVEAEIRKLNESARLPGLQLGNPALYPTFGGGVPDMSKTFYGHPHPHPQPPPAPTTEQHSRPSAPKAIGEQSSCGDPKMRVPFAAKDAGQSGILGKDNKTLPAPTALSPAPKGTANATQATLSIAGNTPQLLPSIGPTLVPLPHNNSRELRRDVPKSPSTSSEFITLDTSEYDVAEDDYVSVPSTQMIGDACPECEGPEEGQITDDWELNF
ncbi:hypothetical protein FRC08_005890 [Ceratobasidium sp. 394]|nr:hypothetical protein FRC08_005890 [Ceratobasidium sp. 394]